MRVQMKLCRNVKEPCVIFLCFLFICIQFIDIVTDSMTSKIQHQNKIKIPPFSHFEFKGQRKVEIFYKIPKNPLLVIDRLGVGSTDNHKI